MRIWQSGSYAYGSAGVENVGMLLFLGFYVNVAMKLCKAVGTNSYKSRRRPVIFSYWILKAGTNDYILPQIVLFGVVVLEAF